MRISKEDRGERFADVDGVRGETKEKEEEEEEEEEEEKKKKKTEEESRIESGLGREASKQTTDVCVHEEEKEELGERGYDFDHGRSVGRSVGQSSPVQSSRVSPSLRLPPPRSQQQQQQASTVQPAGQPGMDQPGRGPLGSQKVDDDSARGTVAAAPRLQRMKP
ncbi:hypothetical protein LX32DRAFT_652339 [Colletotrichum zoysiae]|uniref:Uncharacterized protein n=1 Tax=Colletotrichum zoysiae TaxID=1216348 RepID=A0AAD9HID0_9PEZI|nr:hypothetical protein LX32DRAFT_652339 [Colletotrichum zoysiae]